MSGETVIRELDPERDGAGIVELVHEVSPAAAATVESWRQQYESVPERARRAGWVATVGGDVVARADASLSWFSEDRTAFAGVSVRDGFRQRGIGGRLWQLAEDHLRELAPTRVLTMFNENAEGTAFARGRGFSEVRAETLLCVDPRRVEVSPLEALSVELVPLSAVPPEEVFEVDMITTVDVPMTVQLDDIRFDEWLDTIWRRPTMKLEGKLRGDRRWPRRRDHDACDQPPSRLRAEVASCGVRPRRLD